MSAKGVSTQGVWIRGVFARGWLPGVGVSAKGVSAQGVSAPIHAGIHPPLNRMTDSQMQKQYLSSTSLRTVMNKRCYLLRANYKIVYNVQYHNWLPSLEKS